MVTTDTNPKVNGASTFWKERSFVLWSIPIAGSIVAVFLDSGYLQYFDVPMMYAEINLYTATSISIFLALTFVGITAIVYLAYKLSKSDFILLKLLMQPVPILLALILLLMATLSNQDKAAIYFLYTLLVVFPVLGAIFSKSKSKKLKEKIEIELHEMYSPGTESVKPLTKIEGLLLMIVLLLTASGFVLSASSYVAKHDIWVLASDESTIAIKRNQDIYILKSFDPDSMILKDGFKVVRVGEVPLELKRIQPKSELRTQLQNDLEKLRAKDILERKKDTSEFIEYVNDLIKKITLVIQN